jgi:hypothetical protein
MNAVQKKEELMTLRSILLALLASLTFTPSFAGPSYQHSAQATDHSAQAASHGSVAAVSAASMMVAVPIIAFGSAVTVSGIALVETSTGALLPGADLVQAGAGEPAVVSIVQPNAAATLD